MKWYHIRWGNLCTQFMYTCCNFESVQMYGIHECFRIYDHLLHFYYLIYDVGILSFWQQNRVIVVMLPDFEFENIPQKLFRMNLLKSTIITIIYFISQCLMLNKYSCSIMYRNTVGFYTGKYTVLYYSLSIKLKNWETFLPELGHITCYKSHNGCHIHHVLPSLGKIQFSNQKISWKQLISITNLKFPKYFNRILVLHWMIFMISEKSYKQLFFSIQYLNENSLLLELNQFQCPNKFNFTDVTLKTIW